ncbi:MAG: Tim44 domain-containing protein [Rhodoferax sp.]|nr:Tim44 domain-containing protein [Rhodoferax sp.]
MNRFLSLMAVVLTLGLTLGAVDAEAAKRLGGGKSSGMQRQSQAMDKNAATPAPTPAAPAANSMAAAAPAAAAAAAAPKRSWMGPIAGLAAGLGLAALASHLGFGEELANFLMMGLLAMAVLAVIALVMRRRAAAQRPALATAGGWNGAAQGGSDTAVQRRGYDVAMPPAGGSASGSMIGARLAEPAAIPADFDAPAFERQAKVQFIRLQAAGDAGNLDDIRSFTTPEMFAELRMELAERGNQNQHTDVVSVDARVLEVVQEDARYIVSVRFSGSTRDAGAAAAEAFDEIWHLVKPREGGSGWLLAGIQQVQA